MYGYIYFSLAHNVHALFTLSFNGAILLMHCLCCLNFTSIFVFPFFQHLRCCFYEVHIRPSVSTLVVWLQLWLNSPCDTLFRRVLYESVLLMISWRNFLLHLRCSDFYCVVLPCNLLEIIPNSLLSPDEKSFMDFPILGFPYIQRNDLAVIFPIILHRLRE